MAQPSTSVSSALPAVGICAVSFKGGPSIRILEMENGSIVAYDRNRLTRDEIESFCRIRFGEYELVEPKAGA